MSSLVEIGPGFWNLRASFTVLIGMVDVGTHMSLARLRSGKFLVLSTVNLSGPVKDEFMKLTENGKLIEAVVATHPFHTMSFQPFHEQFPDVPMYGTPRHLRNISTIPWAGDVSDPAVLNKWESDGVHMRIPAGAEFHSPDENNHFSSVFVFHEDSKTVHDDDTIGMFDHYPGFLLSVIGCKEHAFTLHPSTFKNGLLPTKEGPLAFKAFMDKLLQDWDFDNIVLAHNGVKIGGAHAAVTDLVSKMTPKLEELSESNAAK